MNNLRDQWVRRVGAFLVGLALCVQMVLSSLSLLVIAASADPADAFGEHALCLAGENRTTRPATPSDSVPAVPAHDHTALCCLWHLSLAGFAPQAAQTPLPVAYATAGHDELGSVSFMPGPQLGPANPRAPPTLT